MIGPAPKDKQTDITAFSKAFPAYLVEYRKGGTAVFLLWIIQMESVVYDQTGRGKYVDYYPGSDYCQQAENMVKALKK